MLQAFTCTPDAKADPKNPPYLKGIQIEGLSSGDFHHNNYTRYSENSQISQISHNSQGSFFTPSGNSGKKNPVLDDITNLLMNVHPKRLDFSNSLETNSSKEGRTPNYLLRKFESDKARKGSQFEHEELGRRPFHMEIEDIDLGDSNSNAMEAEKPDFEETPYGSTMMDGVIHNINNADTWKKGRIAKNNSNEGLEVKHKTPSLIKRWKKSDKIFEGKYSTGATPKFTKNSPNHHIPLSLIPFKRCNTDVPPTFESDKLLMTGEKSEIGANKYINNLLGTTEINKPRGQSFQGTETLLKNPHLKPLIASLKPKSNQSLPSQNFAPQNKPKLFRDFPLNFSQNNNNFNNKLNNNKVDQGLFLIPEKNTEYDTGSIHNKTAVPPFSNNNNNQTEPNHKKKRPENDFVSKLLTFEEDGIVNEDEEITNENEMMNRQALDIEKKIQIDNDTDLFGRQNFGSSPNNNFASPDNRKVYHTPTKRSPFHEINFSLLDSITAKKEAHSKLFPKDFDSDKIRPFEYESNRGGYDDVISESDENGPSSRSRFEVDYEVLEVLGSGHFGTVYKCQNKLDGLIYAVKCTKNKLKGKSNINQALNEAQALASLSALGENPFIVRYYSAWIEDDRLYLAMEHCQSNLKTLRHQHIRFSESMIRGIMRNICMGLRHLHNQKIVHLDIKPENILYSKTNKFKIADLGLSRIALRSNHEDINEGDCRYLAPELLKDYPDHQLPDLTKADIFSFGASIYELIIGTDLPRNGVEWTNLRAGNLVKLDHLNYSNSLKSMLRSMMSNNPDFRPSAHELLHNYLQSEIELELKWEKKENRLLREKVKELEEKLKTSNALKAKRKNSI